MKYPDEAFLGKNFFSKFYKNCSKTQYLYEAFNQPPTKKCISPFDCAKKERRSLALIRKGRKVGPNHLKRRLSIILLAHLLFKITLYPWCYSSSITLYQFHQINVHAFPGNTFWRTASSKLVLKVETLQWICQHTIGRAAIKR